ncbi:MAG TPA: AAA family ATPase [Gammaproteobacteria bacterium]
MKAHTKVLLAGRSAAELQVLENALEGQAHLELSKRHITNGHSDPLYNLTELPDILIFCTTVAWEEELKSLGERPLSTRPPTVVIGAGNTAMMRSAMRVGAKDCFSFPVAPSELLESLQRIEREWRSESSEEDNPDRFVVVINAKGGSGASTISATLGHGLAYRIGQRVALVDMDMQFGNLPSLFDLPPAGGLIDAALRADSIDAIALEGHMLKHKSGLHLLGNTPQQLVVPGEVEEARMRKLMELLRTSYDHIIADLPRQIDGITGLLLESADRVLLVVQQSVSHIQDAKQMLRYLTTYLGVPEQRITIVVNRWDKRAPLSSSDIEKALGIKDLLCIPNDFARVAESANLGTPLLESAPSSQVSRAMMRLAEMLSGKKAAADESGLGKVFRKWAGA